MVELFVWLKMINKGLLIRVSLVRVQVGEPEKAKARSDAGLFYFLAGLLWKAALLDFYGAGLNGPAPFNLDCADGCAVLCPSCKPDGRGNNAGSLSARKNQRLSAAIVSR